MKTLTPAAIPETTFPLILHALGCYLGQNRQNGKPVVMFCDDEARELRIETVEEKPEVLVMWQY